MRIRGLVRRLRGALAADAGMSLVELGVSMVITALLSVLMLTWFSAGVASENSHRSYDSALADLRDVSDRLGREVRGAGYLTAADTDSLSFWLDGDRDGVAGSGEVITWTIAGGEMLRSTDADESSGVLATMLVAGSGFTYDAVNPGEVTRVTVTLVAGAETRAGTDEIRHVIDIYLRNP